MSSPVYAHRPSKDVTRRIVVDLIQHVTKLAAPGEYQYVGMGALEFIDFDLVHRHVGINTMTSIEWNSRLDRYEANKPYQCIELIPGKSTHALTRIKWNRLSIAWLDYESCLNEDVFADLEILSTKLIPGSLLIITLNAEPGVWNGRRDRFAANVEERRVPPHADDDTLGDWGWAAAQQRLVFSTLRNRLSKRVDAVTWDPLLNINYQDDARMQVIGGVVNSPATKTSIEALHLERLSYVRAADKALHVKIPYLTPAERTALRSKLPLRPRQRPLSLPGLPAEELRGYTEHYQWIGA